MGVNAVVIVGGPSTVTDFRPLSLYQPKPLFPIAGKPLIYHHLRALAVLPDIQDVFIVGYYDASQFADFIDEARQELGLRIRYLREFEPLGTGGGLYHFRDQIQRGEPDAVIFMHMDVCCDFPLGDLLAFHRDQQRRSSGRVVGSILGTRVPKDAARNYGCMVADPESGRIRHYVEKPETQVSDLISCGIYVFSSLIFEELRGFLHSQHMKGEEGADCVMLEKQVLGPLARKSGSASGESLFVYETKKFWRQIKLAR
jgi:mannose-1-phosphate guanylyltransferase